MNKKMYYVLNDNVYLVKGKARSCIYDFNFSKLYNVNHALAQKIDLINKGKICADSGDEDLKLILDKFIKMEILILSEKPVIHKIDEIKKFDYGSIFAWIEITNRCNLRCIHCYNESEARCETIMSLQNYKVVIDKLQDLGVGKVQIIGGEPFFDKEILKDMLNYTVGKFKFIEIFTNGTLITQDGFNFLAENNIHIALSVYSYKEEMHDKVTGCKGSWEKTNRTIEALKSYGIHYRVCNVLMKDIEIGEKTNDLYEISNEKDIVRMSGRANFSLLSDDLIRKKLITKKSFQGAIKKRFCRSLIEGHNCFKNKLYVSANMEVFPCVMERRLKHCVISENNKIILDNSIRNFNKDKINECCHCEYRYVCFDCRPDSLSGDILEKPWYCTYKPLLGEWEDEEEFLVKLKNREWMFIKKKNIL
ncbi:MAG: radical SAM protein [Ruminococcus flavefaciens]|nr:radical SAM protein [Ruminococcus flavefaciens]